MKPSPVLLQKPPSAWDAHSPRLSTASVESGTSDYSAQSVLAVAAQAHSKRPLFRTSASSSLRLINKTTSEMLFYEGEDHHPSWFNSDEPGFDKLHDFSPTDTTFASLSGRGSIFTRRGLANLGTLALLALLILFLFAGYPALAFFTTRVVRTEGAFNLGGTNGSGQVPQMAGNFGLIDADTPASALSFTSRQTGEQWELVFSDEFELAGRTFWPGDDPYWEAEDLHYWATNNLEWYAPGQLETKDGALVVTLDKRPHRGLNYVGGLLSSWNKFCFTGGYIETSIRLPGRPDVYGLWPAAWTMGNLGRAGYGGTLEGMWPYSYDSCDVGTLPNQTLNGLPEIATISGPEGEPSFGALSFLPGQRLSHCTCPDDETHPGPKYTDGTFRGRSAPEIDIIEAQVDATTLIGHVSQSAQWAPFNPEYGWFNTTENLLIDDEDISLLNPYMGGPFQQATSVVSTTNQNCYEHPSGLTAEPCFSVYGFEYQPGADGYIQWINDGISAWTLKGAGMGANAEAEVGNRPVPYEPMYIILNLGLSENFGAIDYVGLEELWPVHMYVDYVRVYQPAKAKNIGCDPSDAPTEAYIERYTNGYTNPNLTTWDQMTDSAPLPKNRLVDTC